MVNTNEKDTFSFPALATGYLNGEKKETFRCNPGKGKKSPSKLIIGKKLDAYFRTFRLFDKALTDGNIRHLLSGEEISPEDSIVWFDFDKTYYVIKYNRRAP